MIIVLPVAALAFFGARAASNEALRWQQAREDLYREKLRLLSQDIGNSLLVLEKEIIKYRNFFNLSVDELRENQREIPFCRQVFILKSDGTFFYPPEKERSLQEESFFQRTGALWKEGINFLYSDENGSVQTKGWFSYYEGNSVSYIFWMRDPNGTVLGFDIFREYLLQEIIYSLPALPPDNDDYYKERIILRDELGKPLYISGGYNQNGQSLPDVTFSCSGSFTGWILEAYYPPVKHSELKASLPILLIITALAVALIGAGILLWRESSREIREARTKVTFVNQVSHELKTPLTNIRMYSEMLESKLQEGSKEKRYASVLTRESERLSRMIQNVLSFSREKIRIHFKEDIPDRVIKSVLEATAPRLEEKGMTIRFEKGAGGFFLFDSDILEQIVWNLISNGEKYAASGKELTIRTSQQEDLLKVEVEDKGPGIPASLQEAVFKPFFRARNDITEGVSGTGLGLAISREMARKHGGDLVLSESEKGALFILTLKSGAEL